MLYEGGGQGIQISEFKSVGWGIKVTHVSGMGTRRGQKAQVPGELIIPVCDHYRVSFV